MLNMVRISGVIQGAVELRRCEDGFEFDAARALLRFSEAQGPIVIFSVGSNTRHLTRFKNGDVVNVRGRLTVQRSTGIVSILVDYVNGADEPDHDERDQSASMQRFARHARIAGVNK